MSIEKTNSKSPRRGRRKKMRDPDIGPEELKNQIDETEQELGVSKIEMKPAHLEFCQLYVNGGPGYSGKAGKCYNKAMGTQLKSKASEYGSRLLKKQHIIDKIKELTEENEISIIGRKLMIEENLIKIMDECSKNVYTNKYGDKISPAALRSVSVAASKALIDMWGLNKPTEVKLTGENEKGIVFNIINPEQGTKEEK